MMMLARIGAGIAGASVGTAAAVIADCTTPQNRARGMALIGIAFGFLPARLPARSASKLDPIEALARE
jgi:hypothetical protein